MLVLGVVVADGKRHFAVALEGAERGQSLDIGFLREMPGAFRRRIGAFQFPRVKLIGAVKTLVVIGRGSFLGCEVDGQAVGIRSSQKNWKGGED